MAPQHGTPSNPPVWHLPLSPLAGPWYKGHGKLEPARNTATGLDGQAGRGTARPRVTRAPHHRHSSTAMPHLPSARCPNTTAARAGSGVPTSVPPCQGHIPSAPVTGINTCCATRLSPTGPGFGMAVTERESKRPRRLSGERSSTQAAAPARFLCLRDTRKRSFPIPPPLTPRLPPGRAVAPVAAMPPVGMPPTGHRGHGKPRFPPAPRQHRSPNLRFPRW